ncbi:uncharacterized protein LOC131640525 [Vicia villosa]|uniref:uncharacterized protein LOC131640525 n=1 Tax=Vicia villosa TaxID=3911 RepID=UPI00273AEEF6|nr:uncharacterized protein LOC131640525 [Vicia villosa]
MQNHPNTGMIDELRSLSTFQRENPPTFKGKYDPNGAQEWLKEIERIFRVMNSYAAHKVRYSIHMLAGEVDYWLDDTHQRLEAIGEVITWVVFMRKFLRKYSTVTEYAAKFVELVKFYPQYSAETIEFSKCIKLDNGLHPETKRAIGCGEQGHCSNECENKVLRCYKCGKTGHRVFDYKDDGPTCFNYGEQGHINTRCHKPKKDVNAAKTNGRMFALSGAKDSKKDNLIRGTCFINNIEFVSIISTGVTHLFISLDCATMLGLQLSSMDGSMIIDTPASGSVTTTFVCKGCPLTIFDKIFVMDLVCLPLHQIDVIIGMNWLEFNYVHINCYNNTSRFPKFGDNGELMLLTAKQVSGFIRDEVVMFAMFASLPSDCEAASVELLVVCELPEVFPDDKWFASGT